MAYLFIAVFSATFVVLGILMLLGKFDGFLLRNAVKGRDPEKLPLVRKVWGINFIADSTMIPLLYFILNHL